MKQSLGTKFNPGIKKPYYTRITMASVWRRTMKIPMFVPPVLILVNIYLIIQYQHQQVEESSLTLSREKRQVAIYNEQQTVPNNHAMILQQQIVNTDRVRHVTEQCAKYENDKQFWDKKLIGTVLATPDHSLIYCDVPKVGCTYLKQVFRFLTHDYEGTVSGPEAIPRVYAHFGPWKNTKVIPLNKKENIDMINKSRLKFMISRDPYARLWSGYLDKLYLPDFWWWFGPKVIEKTRPNAEAMSVTCGHDVTFSEFLEFIKGHLNSGKQVDQHFEPSYSRCNPCKIHFDIIGKMETFSADTKLVLSYTNISQVQGHMPTGSKQLKKQNGDRALEEMKTLTTYNFDIQTRLTTLGKNGDCYNQTDIAFRLWKTFQYNGYLGDEEEFPFEEIQNIQNKDLIKQAILDKLISIRHRTSKDVLKSWTNQREKYLKKAYENVPMHILEGVRDAYKKDFELFQYESEPSFIFKR